MQTTCLLEERWVYFSPQGLTLCLSLLGYPQSGSAQLVTLYDVRKFMLCTHWSPRHLGDVRSFLQRSTPGTSILMNEEMMRASLLAEYRAVRNREACGFLAGFLDPPLELALLQDPPPDEVVSIMLLGPRPLCRSGEKLATFREMVRACK